MDAAARRANTIEKQNIRPSVCFYLSSVLLFGAFKPWFLSTDQRRFRAESGAGSDAIESE